MLQRLSTTSMSHAFMAEPEDKGCSQEKLSTLERELQDIISGMAIVTVSKPKQASHQHGPNFDREVLHRMRILRRWRNGTELCTRERLVECSQFLVASRIRLLDLSTALVSDRLDEVDAVMRRYSQEDEIATSQRQIIGCEFLAIQEKLRTIEEVDIDSGSATKLLGEIRNVQDDAITLKSRLEKHRKDRCRKRKGPPSRIRRIEDHPLVNSVLRSAGRIRRMMKALREGGHQLLDGHIQTSQCVRNDTEVLRRQLRKVQTWQQCIVEFSKGDIEDLQLITTAIEGHIRPDVDLNSPIRLNREQKTVHARLDEIPDETSHENSYMDPPPVSNEAPPPYDKGAFVFDLPMNPGELEHTVSEDEIIDERLI